MLTIIGCGNPNRSDDGAGVAVVRRLLDHFADGPPPGVQLFDAGTGGVEVMYRARGSSALILVDASSSGSEPGAIFEVPGDVLEGLPEPGYGLHGFRWDHALYVGKKIYKREFPERVAVYLIESQTLDFGIGLSEPVERGVTRVVELILNSLLSMSCGHEHGPGRVPSEVELGTAPNAGRGP